MKKKLITLLVIANCAVINNGISQDVHFSQYNYSPLMQNPANAGVFPDDLRTVINYKNQWAEVASPYRTIAFSCDAGFYKKDKMNDGFLGVGIQFFNDQAGDSKMGTTQLSLSLSGGKKLSANSLVSVGIQGGCFQKKFDGTALKWANQWDGMNYNPALPTGETVLSGTLFRPDISAGILWNYSRGEMYSTANDAFQAHAGIAMFHVNNPNISFTGNTDKLTTKYIFHGGVIAGIKNTSLSLLPDFMIALQNPAKEIIAGMYFKHRIREDSKYTGFIKGASFLYGAHYRFGDAIIPSIQLEFSNYAFGIGYDINTSGLTKASSGLGGIEISLRYFVPNSSKGKTAVETPKFN